MIPGSWATSLASCGLNTRRGGEGPRNDQGLRGRDHFSGRRRGWNTCTKVRRAPTRDGKNSAKVKTPTIISAAPTES